MFTGAKASLKGVYEEGLGVFRLSPILLKPVTSFFNITFVTLNHRKITAGKLKAGVSTDEAILFP